MTFLISDSLPNQITRFLTEKIIRGELLPGEWIRETQLAKILGVSRAPIREALHILQKNRLVELMPRKGARVASLSEEYVRWLYDILLELYTLILRQMILNSDPDIIRKLDAIVKKIEKISKSGNENDYYNARFEYARIGLDYTDNQLLKEILMDFVPSLMRVQHAALKQRIGNIERTLTYLRKINDAMRTKNVEKGLAALKALLANDMAIALQAIKGASPGKKPQA
ncbi:MAG TPA: GntR family transcriptional regulator [Smithella sp.]|nr:GntR family transcriptional regulator [Smithella sp.]